MKRSRIALILLIVGALVFFLTGQPRTGYELDLNSGELRTVRAVFGITIWKSDSTDTALSRWASSDSKDAQWLDVGWELPMVMSNFCFRSLLHEVQSTQHMIEITELRGTASPRFPSREIGTLLLSELREERRICEVSRRYRRVSEEFDFLDSPPSFERFLAAWHNDAEQDVEPDA